MEPEEKNMNPDSGNDQATEAADLFKSLQEANNRIAQLETELETARKDLKTSNESHMLYYRETQVLKGALERLRKELNITDPVYYAALLCNSSTDIDIDSLLYQLAK